MSASLLTRLLTTPARASGLAPHDWQGVLAVARAERLIGSLAHRLEGTEVPDRVAAILADAGRDAMQARVQALWEAEMARRALADLGVPVILLKGAAYAAAGLDAGAGRSIGDLDILVPRAALDRVEEALVGAGWEWVKSDAYDDAYYRRWMHELPPLIHVERDRMIDVHHTILPLTARPKPDAGAMIAESVPLPGGLNILSPEDMVVHCAAHLIADGDLDGGLRNLWDMDRLVRQFAASGGFWQRLAGRAERHGLLDPVARALRLARIVYETPVDPSLAGRGRASDRLFARRLLARDGWGRRTRRAERLAFYARGHWLRMPPLMLARHLATKALKRS